MQLNIEEKIILLSVKVNPSLDEIEQINILIPQVQDWDYFISTIIGRGIAPLFYKKIDLIANHHLIPPPILTKLKHTYYKTLSRSLFLHEHFRRIVEAFDLNKISIIALKGILLSEWLYKDVGLRQLSDIDLLIKAEDAAVCINTLGKLGYVSHGYDLTKTVGRNTEIIHYPPMVCNGVSVELHIKLHKESEKYNLSISSLWKNAILLRINNVNVYSLDYYDLLIHLCVHLDKHYKLGHVQFTCFNDITNLVTEYYEQTDWILLIDRTNSYGCEKQVMKYILLIDKYIYILLPTKIRDKYSNLLQEEDEYLFFRYLRGYITKKSNIENQLNSLRRIESFPERLHYLWDILFPSKKYMFQVYTIKYPRIFWLWYPYRWMIGCRGVLMLLRKK